VIPGATPAITGTTERVVTGITHRLAPGAGRVKPAYDVLDSVERHYRHTIHQAHDRKGRGTHPQLWNRECRCQRLSHLVDHELVSPERQFRTESLTTHYSLTGIRAAVRGR